MLRLVRTNQPLIILFLIIYAFIVRAYIFTHTTTWTPQNDSFIGDYVHQYVGTNTFGTHIAALLLVVIQAIMLNTIINNYKMGRELTYFTALCYVLLASAIPEFLYLSPALMGNTFLIIALAEMFKWYRKFEASANIFNVGFWLAVASMFYFSNIAYYFLAVVALFQLRAFRLNELIILTVGLFVPYFFVGVYQFWYDGFDIFMSQYVWSNFGFLDWNIEWITYNYLKIIFFAFLILWVFFQSQGYFFKTSIQAQRNITVLMWCLMMTGLPTIFQANLTFEHLLLIVVPLSAFIAFNLMAIEKRTRAEIVHILLLFIVLCFQFKEVVRSIFFVE